MFKSLLIVAAGAVSAVNAVCSYPLTLDRNTPGNAVVSPDTSNPVTQGVQTTIGWVPVDTNNGGADPWVSSDTVSIALLFGPSTNIQFVKWLVQGTPNTGSFSWTPDFDLTPSAQTQYDPVGYGLQVIDDRTCTFQWSQQFGVLAGTQQVAPSSSAGNHAADPSSSAAAPSSSAGTHHSDPAPVSAASVPPAVSPAPHVNVPVGPGSNVTGSYPINTANCTSTSTVYINPTAAGSAPVAGYTGPQSNGAVRNSIGLAGVVALAATLFL